jgi:hypothetical protein
LERFALVGFILECFAFAFGLECFAFAFSLECFVLFENIF